MGHACAVEKVIKVADREEEEAEVCSDHLLCAAHVIIPGTGTILQ